MTHQLNTDPSPAASRAASSEQMPHSGGVHHRKPQKCHDGVHTIENQGVMPDQTTGPVSGPDFQAPGGVTATPAGPRRCTLEQLAAACDSALFAPAAGGEARLVAPKARLAEMLGCSPQALSSRVDRLCAAGLARRDGGGVLLVDAVAVAERLNRLGPAASAGSAEAHRRFADVFAAADTDTDTDAAQLYRRVDGSSASLSDLAAAAGYSSRGTAAYHLPRRHRRAVPPRPQQHPTGAQLGAGAAPGEGPQQLAVSLVALVADTVAAVAPLLNGTPAADSVARLAVLADALPQPREGNR